MNARNLYQIMLACAALVLIVFLPGVFHLLSWAEMATAIVLVLATVMAGVIAYCGYLFFSIETGYKTEDEISRRMWKQSHVPHPFHAFWHLRHHH